MGSNRIIANYQGFNSSIGSYRTIVQSVTNSQNNIDSTKQLILKARQDLSTRRPILKELRASSLKYDHMIKILDLIEELRSVPDRLELEIAQKQFLSAHDTLSTALRTIDNEDLAKVGGLQPLQAYLSSQESSLFSILIEELSNHLYLKSPYCDTRWSSYSQGGDQVSSIEQLIEDKVKFDMSEESLSFSGSALLDEFLSNFDRTTQLSAENQISEVGSFNYIRLVVETLGRLNKLPNAFDLLHQRLPLELSKVIDKTVSEVRQGAPKSLILEDTPEGFDDDPRVVANGGTLQTGQVLVGATRSRSSTTSGATSVVNGSSAGGASNRLSAASKDGSGTVVGGAAELFSELENPQIEARLAVLKDLAWTLYSKFIAILQGHRVVYEVVAAISSRLSGQGQSALLSYDYFAVVSSIETEIIQLMKAYITTKRTIRPDTPKAPPTFKRQMSIFKSQQKTRSVFKFASSDIDNFEIKEQYDLLKKKLENTVPGLVLNDTGNNLSLKQAVMPYAPTDKTLNHSLLIAPNVLNVRALLEPTVVFLQRAKVVHPYADRKQQQALNKSSTRLLDDFLTNSYLPQLENSLLSSFQNIMLDPLSTQIDPHWSKVAKRPVLQGAISFIRLIKMTCKLLNTGYMYREKYASLIISAIGWLTNFYTSRYNEFVEGHYEEVPAGTNVVPKKMAAELANDAVARNLALTIMHSVPHTDESEQSIADEIGVFLRRRISQTSTDDRTRRRVMQNDLLEIESYRFLSVMTTSIRWIVLELEKMRKVTDVETDPENEDGDGLDSSATLQARIKKRWTLLEANHVGQSFSDDTEYLTLAGKSVQDFDNSISALGTLAETCVVTLRFDLRFRSVYFIDRTMVEGDYYLESDVEERDAFIGLLDTSIVSCDEAIGEALVRKDRDAVIRGLAKTLNALLIYGADSLRKINSNGVNKMYCNILVLQQMLKSVAVDPKDVDFSLAMEFYGHLNQSPGVLIERLRKNDTNIGSDEAKIICRLLHNDIIYKHEQASRREAASQAKRQMDAQIKEIHQIFWGSDRIAVKE
ncbi:Sec8p [Sugiyamaella lignohabitans]|uniref:Exocyst complex component Sec8 n=1 Tax=Sugiyamaella lignohabitans TaxID=796027 RepID=A0A161HKG0_9ASCO|nr:Sec8p [Sugiyamaella lignohabitans]ANB12168.1 Sec8p [Sugiyamaella lignohabitans]